MAVLVTLQMLESMKQKCEDDIASLHREIAGINVDIMCMYSVHNDFDIGEKWDLLLTQESITFVYQKTSCGAKGFTLKGAKCYITKVDMDTKQCRITSSGYEYSFPIVIVDGMRQAYLDKQAEVKMS